MKSRHASYSSKVRLWLEGSGKTVSLAQVSSDWVIPAEPMDLPTGEVNVIVWVDGVEYVRRMHLPNGSSDAGAFVRIESINS